VAAFSTLEQVKDRLADVAPAELDLTDAINECCERAYTIGRWPDAMAELVIATADKRQDTSGEYDQAWFCYLDGDSYDGALGFLVNGTGVKIKPISAVYTEANMGWGSFIDMGLEFDSPDYERRYKMPNGVTSADRVSALVKKRWVNIYDDSDLVPIRSFAALKAGILAINYENENELQLAQQKWTEFENLLLRDDKQFRGSKTMNISYKSYYSSKPRSFM
jgi:hypothetical protein